MNEMPSFADPANLEPKADVAIELEPNATSLTLLQKIYRSSAVALTTRMRAAIAAIQFEHPKLAVTAHVEAGDFADQLEQAIERSRRVMIEAKPIIEANTSSDNANVSSDTKRPLASNGDGHKPSVPDRRYRRW
jgi:polysaccharide pyruvyl transferase WcaK-like protein